MIFLQCFTALDFNALRTLLCIETKPTAQNLPAVFLSFSVVLELTDESDPAERIISASSCVASCSELFNAPNTPAGFMLASNAIDL